MSRRWCWVVVLVLVQSLGLPARAWVEMAVRGDAVVVDLRRDGTAQIHHELMLSVRGGPLERFELKGVDRDAEPTGEPTLVRAQSGEAAGLPRPLKVERQDDTLRFGFPYGPGIRTGRYLVRFSYRSDFKQQERLRRIGEQAELHWQTPVFDDGVDSLKVTFRMPRGALPPRLAGASPAPDEPATLFALDDGVFLAELSRDADTDQLVLTRPHVARGERVDWRVQADPAVFELVSPVEAGAKPARAAPPPSRRAPPWSLALAVAIAGAVFAGLVAIKQRFGAVQPVLRLSSWLRGLLLWAAMSGSLAAALVFERPTLAGVLLVGVMLLTATLTPRGAPKPRGPGTWKTLKASDLKQVHAPVRLPWLDIGCVRGLLLFAGLVGTLVVVALRALALSPYHSAMALVYATAWLPLFCTLGHEDSLAQARALDGLRRRLGRSAISGRLIGRAAAGANGVDEIRLSVDIDEALPGLVGVEVGLEHWQGWFARVASWVVLVRVKEGSSAQAALPPGAICGRGRHQDERVAVFRTRLPIASLAVECVSELRHCLTRTGPWNAATPREASGRTPGVRRRASGRFGRWPGGSKALPGQSVLAAESNEILGYRRHGAERG